MDTRPRILLFEPSSKDAGLIRGALERAGVSHDARRVSTRAAFKAAIGKFQPDLVLASYRLRDFKGTGALKLLRAWSPDVPFILVTGLPREELAMQSLKQGVTDCISRQRLFELGPAVFRALRESSERRELRKAEQGWKES